MNRRDFLIAAGMAVGGAYATTSSSQLISIPKARHLTMIEKPTTYIHILQNFMALQPVPKDVRWPISNGKSAWRQEVGGAEGIQG
jgi:hypothetical protein